MKIPVEKLPDEGLDVDLAATFEEAEEDVEPIEIARGQVVRPLRRPRGHLHLYRSDGNLFVRGDLAVDARTACSRCLADFDLPVRTAVDVVYVHRDESPILDDEVEFSAEDASVALYDGEELDLGELVGEQFELAIPQVPLCAEDCRGLCPSCGADLNREACACEAQRLPSPFEKLRNLKLRR